jgi:hypothetical protein
MMNDSTIIFAATVLVFTVAYGSLRAAAPSFVKAPLKEGGTPVLSEDKVTLWSVAIGIGAGMLTAVLLQVRSYRLKSRK